MGKTIHPNQAEQGIDPPLLCFVDALAADRHAGGLAEEDVVEVLPLVGVVLGGVAGA